MGYITACETLLLVHFILCGLKGGTQTGSNPNHFLGFSIAPACFNSPTIFDFLCSFAISSAVSPKRFFAFMSIFLLIKGGGQLAPPA